jgi:putative endonuclease
VRLNGVQEVVGSNPAGPKPVIMFHVYVLRSERTGRRYIGSAENIEVRLQRHNSGHSKATRHGMPWVVIHTESFLTRAEAVQKELYYKSGRGRDALDLLRQ